MHFETHESIPSKDGFDISYILNTSENTSDSLVILLHGLTGHPKEHLHSEAKNIFTKNGYDCLRLWFYGDEESNRKLLTNTLQQNADDMNAIVSHFKNRYKKIYIAGHSYAGMAMVLANPDVNAMTFWDCTFDAYNQFWERSITPVAELDAYYIKSWHVQFLIGKAMIEEAKNISKEDILVRMKKLKASPQFIAAGDSIWGGQMYELYDQLDLQKDFITIDKADHCFNYGSTTSLVIEKTMEWFEKF